MPTENVSPQPSPPTQPPEPTINEADLAQKAEELLKEQQAKFRVLGNQAKTEQHDQNLQKIMSFAQEKKIITNEQVRDFLHVSQSTATNYLTELVSKGLLRTEGKAKATVYVY